MNLAFLKSDPVADETIEVEAMISAPVSRVWAAWTNPEDLRHWFGREAGSVQSAEVDVRVGGQWCFRFSEADEGGRLEGEYLTVEPDKHLAFTWRHVADNGDVSPQSIVTVRFAALGSKTALAIRHEGIQALGSRQNISHGWNDCMANIEAFLAGDALTG